MVQAPAKKGAGKAKKGKKGLDAAAAPAGASSVSSGVKLENVRKCADYVTLILLLLHRHLAVTASCKIYCPSTLS